MNLGESNRREEFSSVWRESCWAQHNFPVKVELASFGSPEGCKSIRMRKRSVVLSAQCRSFRPPEVKGSRAAPHLLHGTADGATVNLFPRILELWRYYRSVLFTDPPCPTIGFFDRTLRSRPDMRLTRARSAGFLSSCVFLSLFLSPSGGGLDACTPDTHSHARCILGMRA